MLVNDFNGVETKLEGIIQFPMIMTNEFCEITIMLNLFVIKIVSFYNVILGKIEINAF